MRPFYIAGETGSGKSSIALEIAAITGGEIVNADAYQLYKGLRIVSAAPGDGDCARHRHHLYGQIALYEEFNAAAYERLAKPLLGTLTQQQTLPIVVGGSGLYLKSLTHGLSNLPAGNPPLRAELDAMPLPELVAKLEQLDPAGAAQTDANNRRYVSRAVEICILSGRPMSELKTEWQDAAPDFDGVLIERERADLHQRINQRVPKMFEQGLREEIASLPDDISATAEKAIGLREVRSLIAGEIDRDACIEAIQTASRQYAKRQRTWFRRETGFQSVCVATDEDARSAATRILSQFPQLHHG